MDRMSQVNILDLETGKLQGFRLKNTPGYRYLKKDPKNFRMTYLAPSVDDDYIYGLYINIPEEDLFKGDVGTNEVHIFDWSGNFVKRVFLDHRCDVIALDATNKLLYAYSSLMSDELYVYDVSQYYTK